MLLRARRSDKNSWRTWEVTGINHLTQAVMNSAFLIRLGLRWTSLYPSRDILQFSVIPDGVWGVLEVKEWVSLEGFQGSGFLWFGNHLVASTLDPGDPHRRL